MSTKLVHISDIHVARQPRRDLSSDLNYLKAYLRRALPVAGAAGGAALAARLAFHKLDDPKFKKKYAEVMARLRDPDGGWDRRVMGGLLLGLVGASAGLLYNYRREIMKLLVSLRRDRGKLREALLDDLADRQIDAVLISGDLTMVANEAEFESARQFVARIAGLPSSPRVMVLPGNHDVEDAAKRETKAKLDRFYESFKEYMPRHGTPAKLRVGDVTLLGVNSTTVGRGVGTNGRVDADELEFLRKELRAVSRGAKVVGLHHHLRKKGREPRILPLENAEELLAVAREGGAHLIAHGHKHQQYGWAAEGEGPMVRCAGSTTEVTTWRPKEISYRIFDFDGPELMDTDSVRILVRKSGRLDRRETHTGKPVAT